MYGLVGKNLSYSMSKFLHEKIRPFNYTLFETENIHHFLTTHKFKGLNITNPYKKDVLNYADILDESVKKTGVANTLISNNGFISAYNTDYYAAKSIVEEWLPQDSNCAIIGNGATSDTYRIALSECGIKHQVYARHPKSNEASIDQLKTEKAVTVIINTTPVGTSPNLEATLDIDLSLYNHLVLVLDVIYNPYESSLIKAAKKQNIPALNGLLMLVRQAIKSNALFFNTDYGPNLEDALINSALKHQLNLVFIGLPFSGKTHYGKLLGNRLDKAFIDLDKVFETKYKTTIKGYFEHYGESSFRAEEEVIATEVSNQINQVISPGGGLILNAVIMERLKQNSILIYLDLDESLMDRINYHSRPHVKNPEDLKHLKKMRDPLYRNYADIIVLKNTLNQDSILNEIEVKIDAYLNHQRSFYKSSR